MADRAALTRPLANQCILVVDDHEDWLEIVDTVLSQAGAVVTTCDSPEACQALLLSNAFAMVVTDLGFGGDAMAGLRVLPAARAQSGVRVVAITGRKDAEPELRHLGFDAVLVKPIDPFEMVARIASVLSR